MALANLYRVVQDVSGNVVPEVLGTVTISGTSTLAPLFSDAAGTAPLPNPLVNHATYGSYSLFVGAGVYDMSFVKSGYTFETQYNIALRDPAEGVNVLTGTANQVIVTPPTGIGDVTLSLPQSIAPDSNVQFAHIGVGTPATSAPIAYADQAGARAALGLGTMATQNASAVSITGGSIASVSSVGSLIFRVDDIGLTSQTAFYTNLPASGGYALYFNGTAPSHFGGTTHLGGAVTFGDPATTRGNLGLGTLATQNASAVSITGGTARFDGRLEVGATPLLVADPATNRVGVLKAVPTQALDVAGNVAVSQKLFVTQGIELGGAPGPNQALAIQYPKGSLTGILLRPTDGDGGSFGAITFMNAAAVVVGTITTTATATAYNTSSDGRLKERLTPLTGALATLRQLLPVRFRWKADGSPGVGFVAQDVAPVVPEAVTGTPEAPEPMGMDLSKLVPYLVSALLDLSQRLEALEARQG